MGAADLWQPTVILYIVSGFFAMLSFACISGPSYSANTGNCDMTFTNLDNICGAGLGRDSWKSSAGFLVAVGVMMFLVSIVMVILNVIFPSKLPLRFPLVELIIAGICSFLMVIAASVFAKTISDMSDDFAIKLSFSTSFTTWKAGIAFGFFALFAYIAITILVGIKAARGGGTPSSGNAPV